MTTVEVFAPAKINLTLHVTGQRADGYHTLDSLVKFAGVGDRIALTPADTPSFRVMGPFGDAVPHGPDNLACRAARILPDAPPVAIALDKRLPPASGVGGGSADAAATFRGILGLVLGGTAPEDPEAFYDAALAPHAEALMSLGADVLMCLLSHDCRVRGIGEQIAQIDTLPNLPAVLVNPRVPVETPEVFTALRNKANPPMPETIPPFDTIESCTRWLARQRNDLEAPAIATAPVIGDVLDALGNTRGVLLARMSGSGATCFGLYPDRAHAEDAATGLAAAHPDWWIQSCIIGGQFGRALPKPYEIRATT